MRAQVDSLVQIDATVAERELLDASFRTWAAFLTFSFGDKEVCSRPSKKKKKKRDACQHHLIIIIMILRMKPLLSIGEVDWPIRGEWLLKNRSNHHS